MTVFQSVTADTEKKAENNSFGVREGENENEAFTLAQQSVIVNLNVRLQLIQKLSN